MTQDDEAISDYHALGPLDYHEVEQMIIRQAMGPKHFEMSLQIELRHARPEVPQRLTLICYNVRNLNFSTSNTQLITFGYLDVVSLKHLQWEDINYKFFEAEQDSEFQFICREFVAIVE